MAKEKIQKKKTKGTHQEGTKKLTVYEAEHTKKGHDKPKISQVVSQEYDKETGKVKEVYTKFKNGSTKSISTTVPAEQLYFKKSKGPNLAQGNRNSKRNISYEV